MEHATLSCRFAVRVESKCSALRLCSCEILIGTLVHRIEVRVQFVIVIVVRVMKEIALVNPTECCFLPASPFPKTQNLVGRFSEAQTRRGPDPTGRARFTTGGKFGCGSMRLS